MVSNLTLWILSWKKKNACTKIIKEEKTIHELKVAKSMTTVKSYKFKQIAAKTTSPLLSK